MSPKKKNAVVDPITLTVVWNRLLTLTRECGERVVHSAQSYVMGLARDMGPVLLTPEVEIVTSVELPQPGVLRTPTTFFPPWELPPLRRYVQALTV